jgi:uncharacterized cupin superfamily protein
MLSMPPHCHSLEEEIFVVLEGDGHLLLWEEDGVEEHEVRAGSVVVRPASTGGSHAFRGGEQGMTVLMYGPVSRRGLLLPSLRQGLLRRARLITRVGEQLDYWEGES